MNMRIRHGRQGGGRFLAAALAVILLLLGFMPFLPAGTVQAASNRIYVKGDSKTTYSKKVPKFIYVGGTSVNLDYSIGGKKSGIKGTWSSSNPKIVKLSQKGLCKAVGNGEAVIKFKYKEKGKTKTLTTYLYSRTRAKSCELYAKDPADFDGHLEISDIVDFNAKLVPIDKAVEMNKSIKATYKVYPQLYSDKNCTKVHDGSVASLASGIIVTGEGDGVVYLKAEAKNGDNATSLIIDSQVIKIVVGEGGGEEEEEEDSTVTETGAKQTDVNKITVTSVDKITGVSIKLGDTVLVQKTGSPFISEDGHTATVTLPGDYAETTYTILINDAVSGISVKCEKRRVEKIVLDSKNAVLDILTPVGTTRYPIAAVKYKVYDQFGIDLTNNPAYPTTDFISGGIFQISSPGVLSYQFNTTPTLDTTYPIVLTYIKGSANISINETVTLSKPSFVNEIAFQGLYRYLGSDKGYERVATATSCSLSADAEQISSYGGTAQNTKSVGAYYLLFKAKNQYGGNVAEAGVDASQLLVTLGGGLTNLALDVVSIPGTQGQKQQSINAISIDNVDYLAYPMRAGKINAGDANLFVYSVYNANARLNVNISIGAAHTLKSLTVSQSENVYETKATYLNFSAVDTYGNTITDYDTLVKYSGAPSGDKTAQVPSSIIKSTAHNSKFFWEKQEDGTAKLKYIPADGITPSGVNTSIYGIDTLMTMMSTVGLQTFQINVYRKPIPKQVYALGESAVTGALIGGNDIIIRQKDIQIIDQYGMEMPQDLIKNSGYYFYIDTLAGSGVTMSSSGTAIAIDASADNEQNNTGAYKPIISLKTAAEAGSATLRLYLGDASNKIAESVYTISVKSVKIDDLITNGYAVEELGTLNNITPSAVTTTKKEFKVSGKTTDGIRVAIPPSKYSVFGVSQYAGEFLTQEGDKTVIDPRRRLLSELYQLNNVVLSKEMKYVVVINNNYGTELNTSCIISNEQPLPVKFTVNTANGVTMDSNVLKGSALRALITAADQYGNVVTLDNSVTTRFTVSNLPSGAVVDKNGTGAVSVTGLASQNYVTVRFVVNDLAPVTVTLKIN